MKQLLLDTLEYYAEADPVARAADNGERATNLLVALSSNGDTDALTTLLERVGDVLDGLKVSNDATAALRQSAMVWVD